MTIESDAKLFSEFPPVSTRQWEEKIEADLKGADYDKNLVWKTLEGLRVKPYHRSEDLKNLAFIDVRPGEFPYVRGGKLTNEWYIRQNIHVNDFSEANKKAMFLITRGINSLGFCLEHIFSQGIAEKNMAQLLEEINLPDVELNLMAEANSKSVLEAFMNYLDSHTTDKDKHNVSGSLDYDPIGFLAAYGHFYQTDKTAAFREAAELINISWGWPKFRVLHVNGSLFNHAGATIIQEVAFTLSMASEYLSALDDMGVDINMAAKKLTFSLSTGSNYFMEIAKLRAFRLLWSVMGEAYGIEKENLVPYIHCETAHFNKSIYDPNVNMLRTTTEAISAVIGGADSLTVHPYNDAFETPDEFSERIARNQQIILKQEAYLDKVVDPAAGSYYVENLTHSISGQAWDLFKDTEKKGGFIKSFKERIIQDQIHEKRNERKKLLGQRKDILVGVNKYPNFKESMEFEIPASGDLVAGCSDDFFGRDNRKEAEEIQTTVQQRRRKKGESHTRHRIAEPLTMYRAAEPFEIIRNKADLYAKYNGRPLVFMLTYGNLSMRIARSQFSSNFFAAGGFEVVDNNGFDSVEEGIKAAKYKKADIVVLCSSDDAYPEIAPAAKKLLQDDALLVIAGYPKESIERLMEQGIEHFIHIRSNMVEELKKFQTLLNIT